MRQAAYSNASVSRGQGGLLGALLASTPLLAHREQRSSELPHRYFTNHHRHTVTSNQSKQKQNNNTKANTPQNISRAKPFFTPTGASAKVR
eukprot:950725-Amphidinium_carterae.1